MEQTKFWTFWKKAAVVVVLAVIAFLLFGCSDSMSSTSYSSLDGPEATVNFVHTNYRSYNDQYFHNQLPPNVDISLDLGGNAMAETYCLNDNGTDCTIRFNMHYSAAERVADENLLHEMCHIKVWSQTLPQNRPQLMDKLAYDHSRAWRACMEGLYVNGVFHDLIIDNYDKRVD